MTSAGSTHLQPVVWMQILRTYLELFMCEEAVAAGPADSQPLPGTQSLTLPLSSDFSGYTTLIDALPETDSPALFDLPANISRSAGQAASTAVISQLNQITASQVNLEPFRAFLAPITLQSGVSCQSLVSYG